MHNLDRKSKIILQIHSYTSEDAHDHRGIQRDLGAWFEEDRSGCGTCFSNSELGSIPASETLRAFRDTGF